jgi:hypothetical protein
MNERIKQLLGQAYDEAVPETWTTLSSLQQGRIYEKFAELIVRECARIARNTDLEDVEGGDSAVLRAAGEQIKQHFGVEE